MNTFKLAALASASLAFMAAPFAHADEGMWTFDNFPAAKVKAAYGVTIDKAWLDHVQGAAVRINGCSASLVSKDGLVLTNNHCVADCAQSFSSEGHDFFKSGWSTARREDEKTCPGQQAEILQSITDVTKRVQDAGAGQTGAALVKARNDVTNA